MNNNLSNNVQKLVISGLLCALGIIIPLFSPVKILLEPASFTLGSHIAIMIAMFLSPGVAILVSLGTAIGFFLSFPLVVALRALSHIIFAAVGAFILQRYPSIMVSSKKIIIFAIGISILHAACEVLVVIPFFFGNAMSEGYYANGFVYSVAMLVGVGGLFHSLIDFSIALAIWKPLQKTLRG